MMDKASLGDQHQLAPKDALSGASELSDDSTSENSAGVNASPPPADGDDAAQINERLADAIQKEWSFRLRRLPETFVSRYGIVVVVLLFLETLLIVHNNIYSLDGWTWFLQRSIRYRDDVIRSRLGTAAHLGAATLAPLSLWRGWVVPSVLAGTTYVFVALIALRHELYHWKPELLAHYVKTAQASTLARHLPIPRHWWDAVLHVYGDGHHKTARNRIQKRKHVALEDARQFAKVVRVVAKNIAISAFTLLAFWAIVLTTTSMDGPGTPGNEAIARLPPSYVPPLQGLVWYLCNDLLYYYPHWMAHCPPTTDERSLFVYRVLPRPIALVLHDHFRKSHKLHHRTKANLGIAAWYCSPWEQVLFNLVPALIGPWLTQLLADALGCADVWGTHLVTFYVWLVAATASSVLAHTGYRSSLNDPGKHDLHHERAFDPEQAVNFGTLGFFDWLHGTASAIPPADTASWIAQRSRQSALYAASRRSGVPLTMAQRSVVQQPEHDPEWTEKKSI